MISPAYFAQNRLHPARARSLARDINEQLLSFGKRKFSMRLWLGERLMNPFIARLNIEHFRKLLANEPDEMKRRTLVRLQVQEEMKLTRALRKQAGEKNSTPRSRFQSHLDRAATLHSKAREFGLQLRRNDV